MRAQMQQVAWDCSQEVVALFPNLTDEERVTAFRRVYERVLRGAGVRAAPPPRAAEDWG